MLLKPLTDALGLVQERIKSFEREFANNESQTRLSLVDPVLKALGWNPQDPTIVRVEYPVRQRNRSAQAKVDYALLDSQREPVAFVEAKKLGTGLGLAHHQLFEYAVGKSVPYAIATNGADWSIFKQEQTGTDFHSKQLLAVSILEHSPTVTAIKLLSLWRGLLTSQSSIDRIAPALDTLETHPIKSNTARSFDARATTGHGHGQPVPVLAHAMSEASTLTRLDRNSDATFTLSNPPDITGRSPDILVLPDGTPVHINTWSSLLKEIVRWLLATNQLNVAIPWHENPNSNRNVLQASTIYNRKGARIKQQVEITPGLFLLTNHNAQGNCQIAAKLLDDCGIQSSQAKVTLAPMG